MNHKQNLKKVKLFHSYDEKRETGIYYTTGKMNGEHTKGTKWAKKARNEWRNVKEHDCQL